MTIDSLPGSALLGIQRGLYGMRRNALDIARNVEGIDASTPTSDFARSLVEMKQHEIQARASTRTLQAYNDTVGTLLDVRA